MYKTAWQLYQEWELLPNSVPQPVSVPFGVSLLMPLWNQFAQAKIQRLDHEGRLDYLQRCFEMSYPHSSKEVETDSSIKHLLKSWGKVFLQGTEASDWEFSYPTGYPWFWYKYQHFDHNR